MTRAAGVFLQVLFRRTTRNFFHPEQGGDQGFRRLRLGDKDSADNMVNRLSIGVLVAACLAGVGALFSVAATGQATDTATERGLAIAREADRRDRGFGDQVAELTMTLTNRNGGISRRKLRISTLEVDRKGFGDKTLVVFDTPRDVKGVALLSYARVLEPDDQWLYLPALKRIKRISSVNKSGAFVGSEFSYEDMAPPEVDKYTYRFLRDAPCGADTCFVLEQTPRYKYSGYSHLIAWLDHRHYRIRRIDYFDRRRAPLKTLTTGGWRQYLGKYWRAHDLLMENHRTGKTTRLQWSEFRFKTGLGETNFSRNSLKRGR